MKIIFSIAFCVFVGHIESRHYTNATQQRRIERLVPTDLAGYNLLCNDNMGLIICNSNRDFATNDNNGIPVTNTKCDATGTIDCRVRDDPRPLQFCTGLTPYCVETGNTAACSATPQVLSQPGEAISTCPLPPAFRCTDVGDFPDSEDCRKFWRCQLSTTTLTAIGGYQFRPPVPIICPQATVFDPTHENRCRYVGPNQANNVTLCINIRTLCGTNTVQNIPLRYPWLVSGKGQYVATCQSVLRPYVTFCPPQYEPNYAVIPASCTVNCRNPYGKIQAYNNPTQYYICIPTDNVGAYMPVLISCGPFQIFNPTLEQCQFFLGDIANIIG